MDIEIKQPENNQSLAPSQTTKPALGLFQGEPHSKIFKTIVAVLLELILLTGAFWLGINVGQRKAGFATSWSLNYPSNFAGRRVIVASPPGFNPHSLDGTILSTDKSGVVIKDEDSNEQTILISLQTVIRLNSQTLQTADLKTGEEIVVIGEPTPQGQIDAKLIRVIEQN
jgi:hypothetical protein